MTKYVNKETGKDHYGCIADACDWVQAGNAQEDRVLRHAASCRFLPQDLKDLLAKDHAVGCALGAQLQVSDLPFSQQQSDSEHALPVAKKTKSQKEKPCSEPAIMLNFTKAGC